MKLEESKELLQRVQQDLQAYDEKAMSVNIVEP